MSSLNSRCSGGPANLALRRPRPRPVCARHRREELPLDECPEAVVISNILTVSSFPPDRRSFTLPPRGDGMKHRVVSHEEWLAARTEVLAHDKKFKPLRDDLIRPPP